LSHPSKSHKPLSIKKIADLPPPEWLIGGLVPQDGLAVLYGQPAAGASDRSETIGSAASALLQP
jgi:hypothetical protein